MADHEKSDDVDFIQPSEIARRDLLDGLLIVNAGTVNQYVDTIKRREHALDVSHVGDIAGKAFG